MKKVLFQIVVMVSCVTLVNALDVKNHKILNEHIASQNFSQINFSLDSYLKNNLNFRDGSKDIVYFKKIFKWISEGGKLEDLPENALPYARSINHFHDPLTDQGYGPGKSSVVWSQCPIGEQYHGEYSWHDVRSYFYHALTQYDKSFREESFAHMFRGLGQLMHLVEDASVPSHTRNDGHAFVSPYEDWAKEKIILDHDNNFILIAGIPLIYDTNTSNFFSYEYLLLESGKIAGAEVPIANLTDTNMYITDIDGNLLTDPSLTVTMPGNFAQIGLAEYSNANFLSADTMFEYYPYPKAEHCELLLENPSDDGPLDLDRKYISSTYGHPGEQIQHLAVVSVLNKYKDQYFPQISSEKIPIGLDATCHKEYAQKLIPKAIGYSAGLLKYFFRGDINLVLDEENDNLGYVIKNNSDEALSGNFTLFYDDRNGHRIKILSRDFSLESRDSVTGGNRSENISFGVETDAAEPSRFILAFKGTLGLETAPGESEESTHLGAVAGRVLPGPAICITASDEGVYAVSSKDPATCDPMTDGFDRVVLEAKNTSDKDMTDGTIKLVVKYRIGQGNQFQNDPPDTSEEFYYIHKTHTGIHEIPRDNPIKLEFDLSENPIPLYATDVYLYILYEGMIGNETGISTGFKDIFEPTPLHIANVMDRVCLYGNLYEAGSQEAFDLVNPDTVDVYSHDLNNIYIKFWKEGLEIPDYTTIDPSVIHNHVIEYLAAGEHKVVYFLGDLNFRYSLSEGEIISTDNDDHHYHAFPNEYKGSIQHSTIWNQYETIEPEDPLYIDGADNTIRRFPNSYELSNDGYSYYWKHNIILTRYPVDSECTFN